MKTQGFTLIELMIVVAIIAIIAAIALPAYSDFTVRSQVSECTSLAGATKANVSEWYMDRGTWPANQAALGVTVLPSGNYVTQLQVAGGVINCTFGNKANTAITGTILSIRPAPNLNNDVAWICAASAVPTGHTAVGANTTTVPNKYLPSSCKA